MRCGCGYCQNNVNKASTESQKQKKASITKAEDMATQASRMAMFIGDIMHNHTAKSLMQRALILRRESEEAWVAYHKDLEKRNNTKISGRTVPRYDTTLRLQ